MTAQRRSWAAVAVCATLLTAPRLVTASGLAYRDAVTGFWMGIAQSGDVRATGAYAGKTFAGFSGNTKVAIDAIPAGPCDVNPSVVAAFSGHVAGAPPNSGLFLYDALADTISDAVIQGAATPIGGTWQSFNGNTPAIAIDASTCLVHVYFRGQAVGAAPNDTGIFDAAFGPLPNLVPAGPVVVVAQEGVTPAPLPFPGGSVFSVFPASLRVTAASDLVAGGDVHVAFRGQVSGGGVSGANNTGVFLATSSAPGVIFTAAREGDVGCAPTWSGGTTFAEFPAALDVGIGDPIVPFGPQVVFRAKSAGGLPTNDTAIIDVVPVGLPCGVAFAIPAIEGGATPLGGTYKELAGATPVTAGGGGGGLPTNVAFLANISGGPAPKALFFYGSPAFTAVTVAAQGLAGTALGAGTVSLAPGTLGLSVNALNDLTFRASVSGAGSGLFMFNPAGPVAPESLAGGYRNARLDRLGNMTARFP